METCGELHAVRGVVFDVYGTLFEVGDKRSPFRQLLRIGKQHGRSIKSDDASAIMSASLTLREAADFLGILIAPTDLARLERDLRIELASIRLFPDTLPTLVEMQERGLKLGLCSNLAADYADPVLEMLPFQLDAYTWSFEAGTIKPDPLIYARACNSIGCMPANVLMVGDSVVADVEGPRSFGMQSILLDRRHGSSRKDTLHSLSSLSKLLKP